MLAVLLDELAAAKIENLHLPMPSDPRLRRVIDIMMVSPADRGSLDRWADVAGMSTRSLGGGASIQQVAADLGYESVPSFVTMFRTLLGPPGRYMTERHPGC